MRRGTTVVSDDRWELRGCPVSGPALAAGERGDVRVLWYTAGDAGARLPRRRPAAAGSTSHTSHRAACGSRRPTALIDILCLRVCDVG
jgi:hypothetical protein